MEAIAQDPYTGESKTRDLSGIYGYDVYYNKTNYEIAYRIYEATFTDENGEQPKRVESSVLNGWLFNEETIRLAVNLLMTNGSKIYFRKNREMPLLFPDSVYPRLC